MTASLLDHTTAVLAVLGAVGQLEVCDGGGPPSPHTHVPYVVVLPYPSNWYGTAEDPNADVDYRVQLSAVGATRAQAEDAADRVRSAMLAPAAALAPAGRVLSGPVRCEPLRTMRDDDARLVSPLWMVDEVFAIPTTPTT